MFINTKSVNRASWSKDWGEEEEKSFHYSAARGHLPFLFHLDQIFKDYPSEDGFAEPRCPAPYLITKHILLRV